MPRFVSRDVRSWLMLVSSIRFLCSISPSIPFLRRLQNPRYSCFSHLYCFFFLLLLLLLYCGLSDIKSRGGFLLCSFFFPFTLHLWDFHGIFLSNLSWLYERHPGSTLLLPPPIHSESMFPWIKHYEFNFSPLNSGNHAFLTLFLPIYLHN